MAPRSSVPQSSATTGATGSTPASNSPCPSAATSSSATGSAAAAKALARIASTATTTAPHPLATRRRVGERARRASGAIGMARQSSRVGHPSRRGRRGRPGKSRGKRGASPDEETLLRAPHRLTVPIGARNPAGKGWRTRRSPAAHPTLALSRAPQSPLPSRLRTTSNAATARSRSSREWAADTCVRIRAFPWGTTG